MCLPSAPKPQAPPVPPPVTPAPTPADREVKEAGIKNRQRAALAGGRSSTILTQPLGLQDGASTAARKSLLGQ